MHVPAEQSVKQVLQTTPKLSVAHGSVVIATKGTASVQGSQEVMHVPAEQFVEQVVQTTPSVGVQLPSSSSKDENMCPVPQPIALSTTRTPPLRLLC